ncbi:O-succinylbenzoate synthase [Rubritalea squalenifaciens DSM 18772]|uniref:O-succinylbenzoate synthase n=1 Tax=Rubritalea squalenifaciens DSM 18772 TaxID=1123071 RepID=A0A1M6IHL3_9BACT|nr:enolase C-terminal domain-like protein [Rubritalea squalenifaciens]SHJ33918.1 O-succinylbenzoate synthase [Rubritalea squalenifaciens DSM 18772]
MRSDIYIHHYELVSRFGLNSRSDRTRHKGVLIKIGDGVGCIHPWRELGDPSLEELIEDLRKGRFFRPLVRSAIKCAMVDGRARSQGVSVFDKVEVPRSHATIVGGSERIEEAVAAGFEVVKMKAGRRVAEEVELLNAMHERYPNLRWRLDFNNVLDGGGIRAFIKSLNESLRVKIDFLEDPCEVNDRDWAGIRSLYGIPLAVDRKVEEARGQFTYAIAKPALDDITPLCARAMIEGWELVFTSYMDHPIGQCYAAWCSGKVEKRFYGLEDPVAGLMTHGLFEPDAFIERMGDPSPQWQSPGGTGFGFDDLLEDVKWEKLK